MDSLQWSAQTKPSQLHLNAMIRKLKSGEYRLYSAKKNPKTGRRRNLGTFSSRARCDEARAGGTVLQEEVSGKGALPVLTGRLRCGTGETPALTLPWRPAKAVRGRAGAGGEITAEFVAETRKNYEMLLAGCL